MLITRASSINRAMDQIGDKWSLLILQEVFWGINSFSEMAAAIGVSKGVLSDRLKWLQQVDCLQKASRDGRWPRYHLTRKSIELYPSALMSLAFERQFYNNPLLDDIDLIHTACGKVFQPRMECAHCKEDVHAPDVRYVDGPGSRKDERPVKVRRRSSVSSIENEQRNLYANIIHLVGDRWTANVIALAFHRIKRFEAFHKELPVATNVLSSRLKFLVDEGVFSLVRYQQKPSRYEYHLTPKGLGLYPFFLTLLQWGDKWCAPEGEGRPMHLDHTLCGEALHGIVCCSECREELTPQSVRFVGPAVESRGEQSGG